MSPAETEPLIKEHLAGQLKDAIVRGRLSPGQRVVEGVWAREFGVAQATVREAINLLITEGFLEKSAGRSARVPRYSQEDVERIYQVRGALEGLAAQLASATGADLAPLASALDRMEAAAARGEVKKLVESELAFHLALAEASGNPLLVEMLGRLLRPLFTFVLLRMLETHETTASWTPDFARHREIIYLIRDSNPNVAGQFVQHCVGRFVASAQAVWWPEARPKRRRKS
ncbi:MAG: GntR family transcriptional regulator [Candidatus Solibacter sp.]|nr:GntR family transcriptional regulator [Candidatus Solibacter sp.]